MPMPVPGPVLTSDGLRLSTTRAGGGLVQVLVPNGAYFASDFAPVWRRHPALVYDLRNRGASDPVPDAARLAGGIANDVDDLETVRRAAAVDAVVLVAHSYVGVVAMRYAIAHPSRVRRVALLAPAPPDPAVHPAPPPDATAQAVFRQLGQLQASPPPGDAEARCRAFWKALSALYVADATLAPRIEPWGRCHLPNERAFMSYWTTHVEPSLKRAAPSDAELARITCPVLVVHGTADRSAPYAGGEAWARRLAEARLLTLDGVAHAPWIERAAVVDAVGQFLDGAWPDGAVRVPR
jgi:pimeloyl-ACP methyl ester carboxylesterase